VEDVSAAIVGSKAVKIHVCNLMTKPGESDGFQASDFVKLILVYLGTAEPLDYLLFSDAPFPSRLLQRYASDGQHPVELDLDGCREVVKNVVCRPMLAAAVYLRHDPHALARAIMEVVNSPAASREGHLTAVDRQDR
jgi:uncharacterized cofD-like protein